MNICCICKCICSQTYSFAKTYLFAKNINWLKLALCDRKGLGLELGVRISVSVRFKW